MDITTIVTPIIGSVIGYTTNWIAIKMLFKPHKAIYIGKVRMPFTPGVIPREQKRIAKSLGAAVGNNLLTEEVILKELTNTQVIEQLQNYIIEDLLSKPISIDAAIHQIYPNEETQESLYHNIAQIIQGKLLAEILANTQMKNQLFAVIARKVPYSSKIKTLLGEEVSQQVKEIIHIRKKMIADYLVISLQEEELKTQIIQLIDRVMSEKLGGLAAMFVQAESLYTMLFDYARAYLEDEENQEQMAQFICCKLDDFMNLELSTVIPSKDYIGITEKIVDLIEHEVASLIQSENFSSKIYDYIISFSKMDIQLTENMKNSFAQGVSSLYKKFAQKHLPVFIQQFNVTRIVENEINHFSVADVERLIFGIVDKELKAITWLGALLGFIMGLLTLLV